MKLGAPILRAYPVEWSLSDGHLLGRCVPYNATAPVLDELPDGSVDIYTEGFRPGAFSRQVRSTEPGVPQRIELRHSHNGGLGYLGPCVSLEDRDDGLWADFRVLTAHRTSVSELLAEGVRALSIEYRPYPEGTQVDGAGVRWRTAAHLDRVALEARGAYTEAQVMAYRAEMDEIAAAEAAQASAETARLAQEAAAQGEAEAAQQAALAAEQERTARMRALEDYLAAESAKSEELRARYLSRA